MKTQTYKVLSIDAWGNPDDGYEWNQWFDVGTVDLNITADKQDILQAMFDQGFITQTEGGDVEDDQYNLVIVDAVTREPLFAIEYGSSL